MIRLYEGDWHIKSRNEALIHASNYTGFNKEDFKCEVKRKMEFFTVGMNMQEWMQTRS